MPAPPWSIVTCNNITTQTHTNTPQQGINSAQLASNTLQQGVNFVVSMPIVMVAFTCADGQVLALPVRSDLASTLDNISRMHQMTCPQTVAMMKEANSAMGKVNSPPMLDGDFSVREMELAEDIISELEEKKVATEIR